MNTHDIEIELPAEFRSGNDITVTQATIKRERMQEILRAAIEADRQRRGEPVAWLRNERDGYEGKEIFDPLVILGSAPPIKTANGATYSPVFAAPQPAEPVKAPSDEVLHELSSQFSRTSSEASHYYTDTIGFARALLSRYGESQPAISGQAETRMNAGSAARNGGDLGHASASAEPAVWVAADTLYSAHPTCISSLAYMSQIDHDRGREYVPLAIINHHAAPVAQEPVAWMTPGNGRAITELELSRIPTDRGRQDRCREIYPVPLYAAPVTAQAQPVVNRQMTTAARDVLAERQRQIEAEGWVPEHDDSHADGSLALAAACYAAAADARYGLPVAPPAWPWPHDWWKPSDRRRNLVKAGALILAEIARIDRAAARAAKEQS